MIYDELKNYLQKQPLARERVNKDRAIVNLLLERYPRLADIDKLILIDFVKDHNSYDRAWRLVTAENPELRGKDYKDKRILEERKKLELGYTPTYYQDVKQLELLK